MYLKIKMFFFSFTALLYFVSNISNIYCAEKYVMISNISRVERVFNTGDFENKYPNDEKNKVLVIYANTISFEGNSAEGNVRLQFKIDPTRYQPFVQAQLSDAISDCLKLATVAFLDTSKSIGLKVDDANAGEMSNIIPPSPVTGPIDVKVNNVRSCTLMNATN